MQKKSQKIAILSKSAGLVAALNIAAVRPASIPLYRAACLGCLSQTQRYPAVILFMHSAQTHSLPMSSAAQLDSSLIESPLMWSAHSLHTSFGSPSEKMTFLQTTFIHSYCSMFQSLCITQTVCLYKDFGAYIPPSLDRGVYIVYIGPSSVG